MKTLAVSAMLAAVLALGPASAKASGPDWDQVEAADLILFYPGVASLQWVLGEIRVDRERHGGARVFRMGDRCIECHLEDPQELLDIGEAIAGGELLEPDPIPGKPGSIPLQVKAAYSADTLYLKFQWRQPPAAGGTRMDPDNPMKIGFMLDAGKVEWANQAGCWASCHADSKGMSEAEEDRGKYVSGGSLDAGVFYDLLQWRSGEDKAFDGHVAETRVMTGGTALQRATGKLDGDTWTVVFERKLSGGAGDIALEDGGVYNIGVAVHDDHAAGRFHHVTMGYTLGLGTDADIVAGKF